MAKRRETFCETSFDGVGPRKMMGEMGLSWFIIGKNDGEISLSGIFTLKVQHMMVHMIDGYSLVNMQKAMENHHFFHRNVIHGPRMNRS